MPDEHDQPDQEAISKVLGSKMTPLAQSPEFGKEIHLPGKPAEHEPLTDAELADCHVQLNHGMGISVRQAKLLLADRERLTSINSEQLQEIEHWKQVANNGVECSACLKKTPAEPVCLYCAECYGEQVGEIERLQRELENSRGASQLVLEEHRNQSATIARLWEALVPFVYKWHVIQKQPLMRSVPTVSDKEYEAAEEALAETEPGEPEQTETKSGG